MDFGLVLPEMEIPSHSSLAGSPAYMAPEALSGYSIPPGGGRLLDLYALGVIGFELLAGRLPRTGSTLAELWAEHDRPMPDVIADRGDVPLGLARLVSALLSKKPEDRPQSAEAVVWQLRSLATTADVPPEHLERPLRVLIVDDDPEVTRVLQFYVRQRLGHAVISLASDGEQAVEHLHREPPDIMLLDLQMPRMNGIEVCMYMRGAGVAPECQIIAVSAGAQEEDRQLLHELGITRFVQKGADLRERLGSALSDVTAIRSIPPPA